MSQPSSSSPHSQPRQPICKSSKGLDVYDVKTSPHRVIGYGPSELPSFRYSVSYEYTDSFYDENNNLIEESTARVRYFTNELPDECLSCASSELRS